MPKGFDEYASEKNADFYQKMVDLQKMMILNSKKASELDEKSMRLKKEHAEKVNLMY